MFRMIRRNRTNRTNRTNRKAQPMTMPSMIATSRWRRLAASLVASLVALSLFTALTVSLTGLISAKSRATSAASATSAPPQVYQPSGQGTARAHGVVDLSKLPTITAQGGASAQTPASGALHAHQLAQQLPASGAVAESPTFVGGGALPVLGKQFDGLNSTQAGGGWATTAIATDVGYVMQGTTNALAIYSPSSGATLGGPYAAQSFFATVYHSGFTFFDPQLYFDVMRKRWIVAYLESDVLNHSYLDIAVSKTDTPTQQYNVYQFATDFRPPVFDNVCNHMTLGVDYWGIYLSCASSSFSYNISGNTVLAIDKAPMLTGAPNPKTWYWNDKVKIAGDTGLAWYLSPTIVEGQQDAEFVVAIDMGYVSASSSNITVCAVTNQSTMATTSPVFSCLHTSLPYTYSDPLSPRLPGGTVSPRAPGLKQVYYKAGHLFLAWSSASKGQDVIDYAEIRPILRQQTPPPPPTGPLMMYGVEVMAAGTGTLSLPNQDLYDPAIVGTDEDDIVLVFNSSGPSTYPSIKYTGRKATDPDKVMGQGTTGVVILVTEGSSGQLSGAEYAACAISMNSATRGNVWCASQYFRPGSGWSTRIYNLHAE
jgi:hypothetical protein